jgi:hypothetical protein
LNKIAIIAAAAAVAAAAVTITGLAIYYYASRGQSETAFQYNDTTIASEDFGLPKFIPVQGFTAEEIREIERWVCGGVGRDGWVPNKVVFAYLHPKETVYRIPCGQGPSGYFYRSFYFSGAGPAIIDEYHPNAQALFDIVSPKQAAEYVMYFDIVLSGEQDNKQFVITEDQYSRWVGQCIKDNNDNNHTSFEAKKLTVTSLDEDYDVQLNFVDNVSGSFEYRHYMVNRDGTVDLLAEESLGHCVFAAI